MKSFITIANMRGGNRSAVPVETDSAARLVDTVSVRYLNGHRKSSQDLECYSTIPPEKP